MTFLIAKIRASDGKIVSDSSPAVYDNYDKAREVAESLAAADPTGKKYLIFKLFAESARTRPPIETTLV